MLKLFTALALLALTAAGAAAAPVTILALGDSLTAGLGVGPAEAFPVRLEAALQAKGHDVKVINAGVSGDTAADGAARLDWALNVAFHSPAGRRLATSDLAGIAAEKLPSLSLALPEGATLIGSRYPLDRIWNASQPGATADKVDLGDGRADLLVLRRSDDAAFVILAAGEAAFVAALIDGLCLEAAAERASHADPSLDLSAMFARLLSLEAFAAMQQDEVEGA